MVGMGGVEKFARLCWNTVDSHWKRAEAAKIVFLEGIIQSYSSYPLIKHFPIQGSQLRAVVCSSQQYMI